MVTYVSADIIRVMNDDGTTSSYKLAKFLRSNQTTCYNQVPLIHDGERVEAGTVLADGPATQKGEMALGKNLLIAFMPWNGYNYEDAVIISQRLVQDDTLSSIHIEEYEIDARETKLGAEEITRDLPTSARTRWPTSTSVASFASVPRSKPATFWWARSPRRARPS